MGAGFGAGLMGTGLTGNGFGAGLIGAGFGAVTTAIVLVRGFDDTTNTR
jgi:hypothetical protein